MPTPFIKLLYIDDEEYNLIAFHATFRRDFQVFTAPSAAEGLKILQSNDIHVILSDQRMPGMTGIEFFESIVNAFPDPVRILITGYSDIKAVIDAINKGQVYKYLSKPWDNDTLGNFVHKAYEVYRLRKDNIELHQKLFDTNQKLELMARMALLS